MGLFKQQPSRRPLCCGTLAKVSCLVVVQTSRHGLAHGAAPGPDSGRGRGAASSTAPLGARRTSQMTERSLHCRDELFVAAKP